VRSVWRAVDSTLKKTEEFTCRVSSDQSQLDFMVSVDKSFFKPAMNSAGVQQFKLE
jgi:hypothetical protein